jgi:hypothetical protein
MKILTALPLLAALAAASPIAAHAQENSKDDGIEKARAAAFDKRVFGGSIGDKGLACFVRRYDAVHLKQHPKQKVSAMKLLLTAENKAGEPTGYTYKTGVQFKKRSGDFDGGSSCGLMIDENGKKEIRFTCEADCGGAGLEIAMSKDNKSAIVHLNVISIWDRKHPDGDTETLESSADDKVFRLDRVDNAECSELMTDRKEVASLQP